MKTTRINSSGSTIHRSPQAGADESTPPHHGLSSGGPDAFFFPPSHPEPGSTANLLRQRSARPMMPTMRVLIWVVLGWAVVAGCFVTDLFVCPWTAVFR